MDFLDARDFAGCAAAAYDAAVAATPGIAAFCSSASWASAALARLEPAGRHGAAFHRNGHWVLLTRPARGEERPIVLPWEASWCFCCPIAGPDPDLAAGVLADVLRCGFVPAGMPALLGGIPAAGPLRNALERRFDERSRLATFPATSCIQASLDGGHEGFLSRRSPGFRANLRNAERRAAKAGASVAIETPSPAGFTAAWNRILDVHARSWKQGDENPLSCPAHAAFYRQVCLDASMRGSLHAAFLTLDGRDIACCFGCSFGDTFRGLQMAYDEARAALSPGRILQHSLVRHLAATGIRTYDLGMDIAYKREWGEIFLQLDCVVVRGGG